MALVVEELAARLGGLPILHHVAFTVETGQILALLGKNGMGKTTTLKALVGLAETTGGRLAVDGIPIPAKTPPWRRRRLGLLYIPEDAGIFHSLTVAENLRLGAAEDAHQALELFPALEPLWHRRAGLLSGGERKMLALARAWLADARWFLIDEPSLGLAPAALARLAPAIQQLTRKGGVVLVEQNLRFAEGIAHSYALLNQGTVVDRGPIAQLRESSAFLRSLLVDPASRTQGFIP
jgi:branched-chain amino acid transport system ATP-binding protein